MIIEEPGWMPVRHGYGTHLVAQRPTGSLLHYLSRRTVDAFGPALYNQMSRVFFACTKFLLPIYSREREAAANGS